MAINRRRFLALPAIGVPAMVVGKRLGILAWLKSYFFALRGASLTAESIPKSLVPLTRDVDSSTILRFLEDTVERFQRETGISARFVSELAEVKMPRRVCRELACIVQQGLVRVRSHRATQHVLVQLTATRSHWQVTIDDDGRGFPFSGRFSLTELEAKGKGPFVITECVRSVNGELTLESIPGRGRRLEIAIPRPAQSPIL